MTIKDVIKKLDSISSQLDDLGSESIKSLPKTIDEIRYEVDDLSQSLNDDGIDKEESDNEDNE